MKALWRKHKVTFIAAGLVVCMTAALGAGIGWSRSYLEKTVAKAADEKPEVEIHEVDEPGRFSVRIEEDTLYKDWIVDQDIAKQVCEQYDLDYDTVCIGDLTREARNYEEALWLLKNMGESPLLKETDAADGSLEAYINDIYAFDGGRAVIQKLCGEFGLDAGGAVISDLSIDQLIQIGEEAYATSDHPKE